MIASFVDLPREGQIETLCRFFDRIKKHDITEIIFGLCEPSINDSDFERKDWICSDFISSIKKKRELHSRTPNPRGIGIAIVGKADADYSGDSFERRSITLFTVCLNRAPVYWSSKK